MEYKCVTNLEELKAYIADKKIVAFDIETAPDEKYRDEKFAALSPHKSDVTGVSFSVEVGTGVYVPLNHKVGNNLKDTELFWNYLKELLTDKAVIKIAHNLAFEAAFIYKHGIVILSPVYDTIAASQLTLKSNTVFRDLHDSGLKTLVPELYNVQMPKFEEVMQGRHFDELSPQDDEAINYACADSDFTLQLFRTFNDWFDRFLPRHRFICEEIESPTAVYVGIMKYNGLLVDKELMLSKQKEAEDKLAEIKTEIALIIGNIDIGANASTSAFKKHLYKDLGLPVLKVTAKNNEAADDEALILLADWCGENRKDLVPLFQLVQEYRKWGKLKSTYIDGYLGFVNSATNRIHADLFPLGTETGRFSSRNPNLQNMPRIDGDIAGIRNFFIAPEGKVLLSLDLSQIELRVGALFCRDERMLYTYKNNGDIHAQTTSVIYRIPLEVSADKGAKYYKERRSIAKNCNFGVFYGLFPKGLQNNLRFKAGLNISLNECKVIISNLKDGYPRLAQWQEVVVKKAIIRKYSETFLGRRRYLPNIDSDDWGKRSFEQRCALNTPIQGTAADILKLSMVRIIEGLVERPWLMPLLQIHDELVFELPKDRVLEASQFIKECMEQKPFEEFDVPIIAEAAVGMRFGEMEDLK
ncbi:MAG: bifunctional 3'-5' exonuclease/DNA polymerase [Bacillota bacterium]